MILSVVIFFAYFLETNCDQCSNVPFTFGEASVYMCSSYAKCDKHIISGCISDAQNVVHVRVDSHVQKLRQGAIKTMKNLKSVDMRSINLEIVEPGAFLDLPLIDSVSVKGNSLTEIKDDIFTRSNFRAVDLTGNKIAEIDEFAFAFMPRLYGVYLAKNLLDQIKTNWFLNSSNLGEVVLSNNQLTVVNSDAFSKIKRLDYLDLSFNRLHQIGEFHVVKKQLDVLNLAGNQLTDIKFLNQYKIGRLYIGLNNISYIGDSTTSAKFIYPHPNPWQCICLKDFWKKLTATEEDPDNDLNVQHWSSTYPLCVEKLQNKDTCTMEKDEEFVACQEEYFKIMNYSKIENRFDCNPIFLLQLYDKFDNVISI